MNLSNVSIFKYNINYGTSNKKNNNTPNFQGNKQKLVTDSLKIGSAISASALFMMAKKDVKEPEKIIDEYYANENSRVKNTRFNLSRFSEEEKYEINHRIDDINLYPKAFRAIINAKNDETYRFDAQDSMALFDDVGEQIEKYPEIFKQIIDAKDKNNANRFDTKDCASLMKQADLLKAYPKAFETILSIKELNADDCINLVLTTGEEIKELPIILDEALESVPKDSKNYGKQLIQTIKRVYLERTDKQQWELRKQRGIAEIAARYEKEEIKLAKQEEWNKKVGWVDADNFFEKVENSVSECKPLVLESGKILSTKMQNDIDLKPDFWTSLGKLIELKDENGNFKYTVQECIEKAKQEISNQ